MLYFFASLLGRRWKVAISHSKHSRCMQIREELLPFLFLPVISSFWQLESLCTSSSSLRQLLPFLALSTMPLHLDSSSFCSLHFRALFLSRLNLMLCKAFEVIYFHQQCLYRRLHVLMRFLARFDLRQIVAAPVDREKQVLSHLGPLHLDFCFLLNPVGLDRTSKVFEKHADLVLVFAILVLYLEAAGTYV